MESDFTALERSRQCWMPYKTGAAEMIRGSRSSHRWMEEPRDQRRRLHLMQPLGDPGGAQRLAFEVPAPTVTYLGSSAHCSLAPIILTSQLHPSEANLAMFLFQCITWWHRLEEIVEGCVLFRVNSGREDASAMANDFGEIGMSLASQPMTIDWLKDNVRYRRHAAAQQAPVGSPPSAHRLECKQSRLRRQPLL